MERDEYGSSGTMEGGVFTPYEGAKAKEEAAQASAQEDAAQRDAKRKELEGMTVEQLRAENPEAPAGLKKSGLIGFILDGE